MRTLLYGTAQDETELRTLLFSKPGIQRFTESMICAKELEHFISLLAEQPVDLVLVTANGAGGMEAVRAARKIRLEAPRVWFSNDRDFAVQSYRLGCAYFATKPVTTEKLQKALLRCGLETKIF